MEYNHYNCDKREGLITKCQLPFIPPRNVNIDYANDSHSFAYLNDKLMKISIDYKLSKSSEHGKHYEHILKAQPVEYQYVTLEE